MEGARIARAIVGGLYVATVLYYTMKLYAVLAITTIPYGLKPLTTYGLVGLSLAGVLSTRLYWAPLLALVGAEAINPITTLPLYILPAPALAITYRYTSRSMRVESSFRLTAGTTAYLLVYMLFAITGYGLGYLLYKALSIKPPLTGDADVVVSALSTTLAYRILVSAILLSFAYKALSSLADLTIAYLSRGEARRALRMVQLMKERETIVEFKGAQYGALEWGSSILLTLLVAPIIYPPVEDLVSTLSSHLSLGEGWIAVLASLTATIIAWIPLKMLVSLMVRTLPSNRIRKPSYAGAVYGLTIALLLALAMYVAAGYDPIALLKEAVHGTPSPAQEPLSGKLANPGEDYYKNLARILDLMVQLFWGG